MNGNITTRAEARKPLKMTNLKKKHKMKVIIAGTRTANDYRDVHDGMRILTRGETPEVILTGGAKGADELGKKYAETNNLHHIEVTAEWRTYGKKAGPIRNAQLVKQATHLLAIWDGKSKGTKSIIDQAKKAGLKVLTILY